MLPPLQNIDCRKFFVKQKKKITSFLFFMSRGGDIHPLWKIKRMHRGGISPPNPNKWGGYHPLTHIRGWISPPRRGGYPPPVGSSCDVGIGFLLYFLSIFPHFSFWYRNILVSVPSHIQNQLEIFPVENGLWCPDEKETGWKHGADGGAWAW